MKKIILAAMIVGLGFISCEKTKKNLETTPQAKMDNSQKHYYDFVEVDESTKKQKGVLSKDLFDNNYINNLLAANGLSYKSSSTQNYSPKPGSNLYLRTLNKSGSGNEIIYNIFLMSNNDNLTTLPILTETKTMSSGKTITVKSLINNAIIGVVETDVNSRITKINGLPVKPLTPFPVNKPTCPESTTTFKDCFSCAWSELNDDLLGTVSCIAAPYACVIACATACAFFGNAEYVIPTGNDPYTYVNSQIDLLLETKYYNGKENISYNGKQFIFLY